MNQILVAATTLCALIALSTAEYTIRKQEDLLRYRKECVAELGVPAEYVERFKKWDFPNDSTSQCYLKCVFGKFEFFDTANGFNIENIHQQLAGAEQAVDHNDELHQKIKSCIDKNEQGSNACEWAFRGATCFLKNNLRLVQQSVAAPVKA